MQSWVFYLALSTLSGAPPALGVNIHFTGAPARDLDLIRDAGFGWVRMDLTWGKVEKEKGTYRFEEYDQLVDGLAARGLRALLILDYSNKLYETEASVRTEEGRRAFAAFAAAAAARYRGRGVYLEIWNEPNLAQFWKPEPSADDYLKLALEAARAIRAADPQAVILAPASSGIPVPFLEKVFDSGLLEHIDLVSVHPYRNTPPETVIPDYARLRQLIRKHQPPGKKAIGIASGEWGYSNLHYGGQPFTLDLQGAFLARQFLTNLSEGIVLSIWYDWANDGPDPKETEHNFGTVTQDRKPKPAYQAARALTAFLKDASFAWRLRANGGDHLLLFSSEKGCRLAAWTAEPAHQATVEVAGQEGEVEVINFIGERSSLKVEGGVLELPLDEAPRYLSLAVPPANLALHSLEAEPCGEKLLIAARRSGRGTARGKLEVLVDGSKKRAEQVVLEEGKDSRLEVPLGRGVRVSAVLKDAASGRQVAALPARAYAPVAALSGPPSGREVQAPLSTVLGGDQEVVGSAKVYTGGPPAAGLPVPMKSFRLEYRFEKGWKFALVVPPKEKLEIPGRPVHFSVWVEGDGSGNTLRTRFRDTSGETFQSSAGEVNWKGWRRVELSLDGSGANHWGGNDDGRIDYPIRWDAVLVLDSTRAAGSGSIRFAGAALVYPEA